VVGVARLKSGVMWGRTVDSGRLRLLNRGHQSLLNPEEGSGLRSV
jgi:hypothetical protein